MKICCISDTHGKWNKLVIPECDILISTGDYSFRGEKHMIKDFHAWLSKQEAGYIISVQGNHEVFNEKNYQEAKSIAETACPGVFYMEEGLVEIEGLKIWCSAYTPFFHNWSYNVHRGPDIKRHWDLIPDDVNVIACHGPPAGIMDMVYQVDGVTPKEHAGCVDLLNRIAELRSKSSALELVCFGHIHSGHGMKCIDGVTYVNASICGETYAADYEPIIVDL